MPRPIRTLLLAVGLACSALGVGACGDGQSSQPPQTSTNQEPSSAADARRIGQVLLNRWGEYLMPTLFVARDRTRAFNAGDIDKAARLDRQMLARTKRIEKWGRDAGKAFLDSDPNAATRAVTVTGDAWMAWAYEQRVNPPRGDLKKAQEIADLGADALRKYRRAARLVGYEVPPAFQG